MLRSSNQRPYNSVNLMVNISEVGQEPLNIKKSMYMLNFDTLHNLNSEFMCPSATYL